MSDNEQLKELIDSFVAYRKLLTPLQENLKAVSESYEAIRTDLDSLTRNLSGSASGQLDRIHSTLNAQARSGQELSRKIDEYAASGDRYAAAVNEMTKKFAEIARRIEAANQTQKEADALIGRLDAIASENRQSYNLKDLQRALENYNKNIERVNEFINKDVAETLKSNAEKIDSIKRENEALTATVTEQGKTIAELLAAFAETSRLLKKTAETGSVNEQYLYEAFDNWAADRKVKIKKK